MGWPSNWNPNQRRIKLLIIYVLAQIKHFSFRVCCDYRLALWVKFSADYIYWNIFLIFFLQKTGFDISYKLSSLETICMKCQNLFVFVFKNCCADCNYRHHDYCPFNIYRKVCFFLFVFFFLFVCLLLLFFFFFCCCFFCFCCFFLFLFLPGALHWRN